MAVVGERLRERFNLLISFTRICARFFFLLLASRFMKLESESFLLTCTHSSVFTRFHFHSFYEFAFNGTIILPSRVQFSNFHSLFFFLAATFKLNSIRVISLRESFLIPFFSCSFCTLNWNEFSNEHNETFWRWASLITLKSAEGGKFICVCNKLEIYQKIKRKVLMENHLQF
jgi:hypothetical protein